MSKTKTQKDAEKAQKDAEKAAQERQAAEQKAREEAKSDGEDPTPPSEPGDLERAGVGNGGGLKDPVPDDLRAGVRERRVRDYGDRKVKRRAEQDQIFTQESKDKWGDDQPTFGDLLKESTRIQEDVEKSQG